MEVLDALSQHFGRFGNPAQNGDFWLKLPSEQGFQTRILVKIFENFFEAQNTDLGVIEGPELVFRPFGTILQLLVLRSFLTFWTDDGWQMSVSEKR